MIKFTTFTCTVGGSHEPIVRAITYTRTDYACFVCSNDDPATGEKSSNMQITGKWLPALIMNNGLMQGMAFLHEKGQKVSQKHCAFLGQQLRAWLKWLRKMAAARQG